MRNVRSLVNRSMKILGVYSTGENVSAGDAAECFEALNDMMATWWSQRYFKQNLDQISWTTVSGVGEYMFGPDDGSGNEIASSSRMLQVFSGFIRITDSSDYPIEVRNVQDYDRIGAKSVPGIPSMMAYSPNQSTGYLVMSPVPDGAFVVKLRCSVGHTAYTSLDQEVVEPMEYHEAMIWGLAVRLSSTFGRTLQAQDYALATMLEDNLKNINQNPPPLAKFESGVYRNRSRGRRGVI